MLLQSIFRRTSLIVAVCLCLPLMGHAVDTGQSSPGTSAPLKLLQAANAPWVKTDSAKYVPGTQVGIGGGNFYAGEPVKLQVVYKDGSPNTQYGPWTATVDGAGSFRSTWNMASNVVIGETLLVSAQGQISLLSAQGSFLAAGNVNLDQLQNGTTSSSPEWANGNINTSNSCYSEGNTVPFRYFITNTTASTKHFFTISMEWTKGGVHAYDYLNQYNLTEGPEIATAGGECGPPSPPGDCVTPTGTYPFPNYTLTANYTGSIPSDFFTTVNPSFVLDGPGNLYFYNATIDSIGKMFFGGTASDRTLNIPVYFTTTSTGSVGFFWGGHLSSGNASTWGVGNGSASVGGAPYHMRAIDFDGGGGANQDRSIQNGSVCLPPDPTITCGPSATVCKDSNYTCTAPAGAASYSWFVTGGSIVSGQGTNSLTYKVTAAAGGTVTLILSACDAASGCAGDFCCAADTVSKSVVTCNICPVATCHGDTSIYLCAPQQVCIPGFSCSDANGNLVSCSAIGGTLVGNTICFTPSTAGVYTLKLVALDGDGCADTCETKVTVAMNQAPVATCHGDTTFHVCTLSQICLSGFTASDPDGNLKSKTVTGGTLAGSTVCFTPVAGPNTIRLIAEDSCGRKDTCETVVTVVLNQPPVANCHGDTAIFVCSLGQICLPGFSSSDPDGNLKTTTAVGGTLNAGSICFTPVVGVNTLKLIATDSCGAADTCVTQVTVAMNNPPVATCPGDQTVFVCNLSPICIDGFSCSDPDGNGTGSTVSLGTLNGTQVCFTPVVGANTIRLICTDACGKADTCQTVITVALNAPPTVSLGADKDTSLCVPQQICVGYTVNDPNNNVTLEELLAGPAGAVIDTVANTVCFTPASSGSYSVTVKVTDQCGANSLDTQVIQVHMNQPPSIVLANDTSVSLCQPQSLCFGYVISDPDGLAGLTELLVSGPAGASLDTVANKVCFTPAASGTFTCIVKVTDACGSEDVDTVIVQVVLNAPPVVTFGPDKAIKLCSSQQLCETYSVADPNGLAGITEVLVSAPAGANLDTAANKVCYTPTQSGTYTFIVKATDPCGASDQDTVVLTVTINTPPYIAFTKDSSYYEFCSDLDTSVCVIYTVNDADGGKLVESLVSGAATIDTAANKICLAPNANGKFVLVAKVTDSCGAFGLDTTIIVVKRVLCCPTVAIEKVHNVLQGTYACIDITMQGSAFVMGGFNLLIAYDASALNPSQVTQGSLLTNCKWEYFTYRFGANGNCSGTGCPSGLIRIVAIAEANTGASHPSCFGPVTADTVQLAQVCFLVSNDRRLECQYAPVRFFWIECGDNTFSTKTGDTLLISDLVYDFDNPSPINNGSTILPSYNGAPNYCAVPYQPNKPAALRCIDFYNGGVDIVCADSIDARGDINLNGLGYEIADAVLFSRYFVYGLSVFTVNQAGQTAASDANADGLVLTVADLTYLIKVVVGDAQPYAKVSPVITQITNTGGVLSVSDEMGGALVVVKGNVEPTLLAQNMQIMYHFDGAYTRVLVYPSPEADHLQTFSGAFLSVPGEVISMEFGSAAGSTVIAKEVPNTYQLSQNYPNPFNPSTTIEYNLPTRSHVTLFVFDMLGREIRTLVTGEQSAGMQKAEWDGRDNQGNLVGSGIYFFRLQADGYSATRKMVLLK